MKNNITKNFTIAPNELINDVNLDVKARFLFIWLASKPENWKFHNSVIERSMNFTKNTRIKYLKQLINSGWISVDQKMNPNGTFGQNEILLNPRPKFKDTEPDHKKTDAEKNRSGKIVTLNKTNNINNTLNNKKTKDEAIQILNFLNEKKPSSKPFKPTSGNLSCIISRLKEGFEIEDFETVILCKINEWKNTQEMKKFIRPSTLFSAKKFNSYLIEGSEKKSNDGSENFELLETTKSDLL